MGNGSVFCEPRLVTVHLVIMVAVLVFFTGTFLILKLTDIITPLRVSEEKEMLGLDLSQYGEKL